MQKPQAVRGTRDLFGDDILKFNLVVDTARKVSEKYGFKQFETPIFEFSDVFEKNLGETSDIIEKEVYKFKDRGDNYLTLRPEFTAGIVRAFLNNGPMQQQLPQKLFSYGPVFRYDRPQKGRYRQFYQINCECIGSSESYADVETIKIAYDILKDIGLKDITLEINSLGCPISMKKFEKALIEYLNKYKDQLSEDSKKRLEKNPLRILDSKDETDKKIVANAPIISEFYTKEAKEFFDQVLQGLKTIEIKYKINPLIVRGLDYYTSTVFEFTTNDLGAQNAVLGGGRYDDFVEQMGGKPTPAIGFGGGIDRMMLLTSQKVQQTRAIAIVPISDNENEFALKLANELREKNLCIEFLYSGKIKKKLDKANFLNAKYAIIIGEDEIKTGELTVKDLDKGENKKVVKDKLIQYISQS